MSQIEEVIQNTLFELLKVNATSTPKNIEQLLRKRLDLERSAGNSVAVQHLELIIKNFEFGKEQQLPICQDTGMINIIVKFNPKFQFPFGFRDLLLETIKKATLETPLRPNSVDPFTSKNSGNNVGHLTPPIYFELDESVANLKLTVLNKGGGAENMSQLFMMNASADIADVKERILDLVKNAGGKPCPPIILGIGFGGDSSNCMYLAKKALTRPLFSRNKREDIKKFENELLEEVNKLNVGVMGMGGLTTCLDVRVEWALRHPASYPVGVVVQCYAHRVISATIDQNANVNFIHE